MITMYGIPNCDTIKKARLWLKQNNIEYQFHDYKKNGIDSEKLEGWCAEFGHENLLNRRGTTWRKLNASEKDNMNQSRAINIMKKNTSIIKRPVLEYGQNLILGFDQDQYKNLL